jgi:hypothetical protein
MFLKNFRKPRKYNSYWTFGPQNIYQIDTFSIFKLLRFADYEIPKGLRGKRGPYILVVIDLYSRYVDAEFLKNETFEDIAATLTRIFERMGKPLSVQVDSQFDKPGIKQFFENQGINVYVYKPYEVIKNQVVERVNRTIKSLILKYLNMYGWPGYENIKEDVNHILRAICWYYNHRYHHGIRAIPWEVFNDLDDNKQNIYIQDYPLLPIGSIVYRKPTTERGLREGVFKQSIRVFDFDPEPFEIIEREGIHVGKYRLRSIVNPTYAPSRWYKPYELIPIDRRKLVEEALSELTIQYLRAKYGDQVVEQFIDKVLQL